MKVLLSTTILLEEGSFTCKRLTLEEAKTWLDNNVVINFCGHQTTKILGISPATGREQCESYSQALCLKPLGRLEFGREYSVEEIEEIGVDFLLITKQTKGN